MNFIINHDFSSKNVTIIKIISIIKYNNNKFKSLKNVK